METTAALPFYQKRHEHFDRSYRYAETRSIMQKYLRKDKKRLEDDAESKGAFVQRSSVLSRQEQEVSQKHRESLHLTRSHKQQQQQQQLQVSSSQQQQQQQQQHIKSSFKHREVEGMHLQHQQQQQVKGLHRQLDSGSHLVHDDSSHQHHLQQQQQHHHLQQQQYQQQQQQHQYHHHQQQQYHQHHQQHHVVEVCLDCHEKKLREQQQEVIGNGLGVAQGYKVGDAQGYGKQQGVHAWCVDDAVEDEELEEIARTVRSSRKEIRKKAAQLALRRKILDSEEYQERVRDDKVQHSPEFLMKPRSHVVWEKSTARFNCTVQGRPTPHVKWFKNNKPIDVHREPGKFRISSNYGVHALEINWCSEDDTAQYRVSAISTRGETSCFATLVVKRFRSEFDETSFYSGISTFPFDLPLLPTVSGLELDVRIMEKFGVTFGREGETLSLCCTVVVVPNLHKARVEIQWFRDDVRLEESKWVQLYWSGEKATLVLAHLNKEDEGLYTVRVVTTGGAARHSAYVFVRDAAAEIAGAPPAPLGVEIHDPNRNYVIVSWKPPSGQGGSPITGYFVERREVNTEKWVSCNDAPVLYARWVAAGLVECHSYQFRVRAVNSAGLSLPSRPSEPVIALHPDEAAKLKGTPAAPWTGQIFVTEEEPTDAMVPSCPQEVAVTEISRSYAVLGWKVPVSPGSEAVTYYVEKSTDGGESWERLNGGVAVKSTHFAALGLVEGKSYQFRVLACNSTGLSEPSEETLPVTAHDKLIPPSAPESVTPEKDSATSVLLNWKEVADTQGLLGYYTESRACDSKEWQISNNNPVKRNNFVVHGLKTGGEYVFRVRGVNAAGFSSFSKESAPFKVEAPVDLPTSGHQPPTPEPASRVSLHEAAKSAPAAGKSVGQPAAASVRAGSPHPTAPPPSKISLLNCSGVGMVLHWQPPAPGKAPLATGYRVEARAVPEGGSDSPGEWHDAKARRIEDTVYEVQGLAEHSSYQFRVSAENPGGLGCPSEPSQTFPCEKWTFPEPGPPFGLAFSDIKDGAMVVSWKPPLYAGTSAVSLYHVELTEADAVSWRRSDEKPSASTHVKVGGLKDGQPYLFRVFAENAGGRGKMSEEYGPVVARGLAVRPEASKPKEQKSKKGKPTSLKSPLAVEVQDNGTVRFSAQLEDLSASADVKCIFDDKEIEKNEKYDIKVDVATGLVEVLVETITAEDEGSYSVVFKEDDGKENASNLPLLGDDFKKLLEQSEKAKRDWKRKQGPYVVEQAHWEVMEDCNVRLICKVSNIKKQTSAVWFKDGKQIMVDEKHDFKDGIISLHIAKITKRDAGVYKLQLKDERGDDSSVLQFTGKTFDQAIKEVCKMIVKSAAPLKAQATEEGVRIHSTVKHCLPEVKSVWFHAESKLTKSERLEFGSSDTELWMKMKAPVDKDKGTYRLEATGNTETVKLSIDLSGKAFAGLLEEYQKLELAANADKNNARIVGGLPDVVSIMEGKTLNLTCSVAGEPVPEATWLKHDKVLSKSEHYIINFEEGRFANLIIQNITMADTGKYGIVVTNKYGKDTADFTLNVTDKEE
uniref:M-protein, striated muscle-like isoform X2 n=1 Tax=Petromyzon marinus TaxID=7757 RepID=A0AAJ7T3Y0_PETMA|nr:M-protein, striated muscle-like isoform X2 [Petromyzon marinus]